MNGYGGQNHSWMGDSYGASREATSGAAEVLRNMSNTAYTPNPSAMGGQAGFTATDAAATAYNSRYSNNSPAQQGEQPSVQQHPTYDQNPTRPLSVNTNGSKATSTARGLPSPATTAAHPSQRNQDVYSAQQQQQQQIRSASPAQRTYSHAIDPASTVRSTPMTAASHDNDYSHRQLSSGDLSRSTQPVIATSSYSYPTTQITAPLEQPSAPVTYSQSNAVNTVDPMAVYDPWPEYQRQQEAIRAQKAAEEAVRSEEEGKLAAAREAEARKQEQERKKVEEERRTKEIAKQARQNKQAAPQSAAPMPVSHPFTGDPASNLEAEIRAMMAKMRELNGKDPALLAKIWDEERRTKAPKSPTVQNKQISQAPPTQPTPAPVITSTTQPNLSAPKASPVVAAQRGVPKQVIMEPPITLLTAQPAVAPAPVRPTGNTVWPQEKREELGRTAAAYLNNLNPSNQITSDRILTLLSGNPSYIELCEQLEKMSLRLDRAVFAQKLLAAVPDINSTSRAHAEAKAKSRVGSQKLAGKVNGSLAQRTHVPSAILTKIPAATRAVVVASPQYTSPYPQNTGSASQSPVSVAQMVPMKAEFKPPANKEEAARKRNFGDLIDLTSIDDEDAEPVPKKQNIGDIYSASPAPSFGDVMEVDRKTPQINNFPISSTMLAPPTLQVSSLPQYSVVENSRLRNVVQSLEKRKALRRNSYNPATIARDVLLASGRHPEERQLNAHLDALRVNLSSQIPQDADLTTVRWDLLDPGKPPKGYYKSSVQALAEDADDEDESVDEAPSQSLGVGAGTSDMRAQAPLSEATNPFKLKRRGRPRHSFPKLHDTTPPKSSASTAHMSASKPRPTVAAGVGYSAFRAVADIGPDGTPLPKKRGRPAGWRKAIHGSAAAQGRPGAKEHTGSHHSFTPSQLSALRNVQPGNPQNAMEITSRSPSTAALKFQSFKCKWQNCKADLHNLETLRKHVQKLHRKETLRNTLECLWGNCGKGASVIEPMTGMLIEKHTPHEFTEESQWREHIEIRHFGPLSWELGDGPASGVSDAHDSEAHLSDAQGRRVTPRIVAKPQIGGTDPGAITPQPRGRGRPPKASPKLIDAQETMRRIVAQKKRIGGPGVDRGGATFVNEKRRKGFSDDDRTEEEFVDAEL